MYDHVETWAHSDHYRKILQMSKRSVFEIWFLWAHNVSFSPSHERRTSTCLVILTMILSNFNLTERVTAVSENSQSLIWESRTVGWVAVRSPIDPDARSCRRNYNCDACTCTGVNWNQLYSCSLIFSVTSARHWYLTMIGIFLMTSVSIYFCVSPGTRPCYWSGLVCVLLSGARNEPS